MLILGVTLARGGSKSVPRKNIANLLGKPLIAYTIEEVKKSKFISDYIVSSDDKEIIDVAETYGANCPFVRPSALSGDKVTSVDALIHAVSFYEASCGKKVDYVVELMATNPLKDSKDIDFCIEMAIRKKADSVIAINRVLDNHPARIKQLNDGGVITDFCVSEPNEARRQDLRPFAYVRSGAIYVMSRSFLMEEKKRYGGSSSFGYVMDDKKAVNIDSEIDLYVAECLLRQRVG